MADVWAAYTIAPLSIMPPTTTIRPPSYDGIRLWFTYEEDIDEWCEVTELSPRHKGRAIRHRLKGDAAVYKSLLEREPLQQAYGAQFCKTHSRHHLARGVTSVLIWRCLQQYRFHRGRNDMMRWLGRTHDLMHRAFDDWVALRESVRAYDPQFWVNAPRVLTQVHVLHTEQRR